MNKWLVVGDGFKEEVTAVRFILEDVDLWFFDKNSKPVAVFKSGSWKYFHRITKK